MERFDRACVGWLAARRRPGLNELFVLGSHTGEKGVPWAFLLTMLRLRAPGGDRLPLRRALFATLGSWAAAHALKRLDHRRRPCQEGEARSLVACPKSSSLPSDEGRLRVRGGYVRSSALAATRSAALHGGVLHGRLPCLRRCSLPNRRRGRSVTRSARRRRLLLTRLYRCLGRVADATVTRPLLQRPDFTDARWWSTA